MLITTLIILLTTNAVYNVDTEWIEDSLKKETIISVKLVSAKGWKWNAEYPFKYDIQSKQKLELSWSTFDHQNKTALFIFSLKEAPKELQNINVVISFSFCNKEACRVWRKKVFHVRKKEDGPKSF